MKIDGVLEFNEYWIGALLHDVGKLVLGFFFWDWVNRVQALRKDRNYSFRQAEAELGEVADHERVGRLLLLNADMGQEIVAARGHAPRPGRESGQSHLSGSLGQ